MSLFQASPLTNSGVLIRGALAVGVTVTDVGGSFIFFFWNKILDEMFLITITLLQVHKF